ncbi:MAG: lysoplasmalogenase [Halioglobus sp.]
MTIDSLPLDTMAAPIGMSVIAVTLLVVSDLRGSRLGRYICKPIAAAAFIWLAWALGAANTQYGQWMLAALILCMLGDLFLMPDSQKSFLAGLTAFLCGHLLFAVAFYKLHMNVGAALASAVPAVLLLALVGRWLHPHIPAAMKAPVALYIVVITAMLVCAGFTIGHPAAPFVVVGAWAFAASDLAVARRQFIDPSRVNALWGTPLYFGAQMVLATSIAFA